MSDLLTQTATDAYVEESLGYRESFEHQEPVSGRFELERVVPNWGDVVSKDAYAFIVRWETGGRPFYEQKIKGRPIWPGYSSGITIGCGYDLGYHTMQEFQSDWGTRIPATDISRLAVAIGFKTVEPGRDAKVVRAKELVQLLNDVMIGWDTAIAQFDESKMPNLVGQLERALPNLEKLHAHSYGALLSLVFNRGTPFKNAGPRYTEMVEIRRLMEDGTKSSFEKIPDQFRSMVRIWGAGSGLAQRRLGEAELFTKGLREMQV